MAEYIERESLLKDLKQYYHCRIDNDEIVKMGFLFVQEMTSISRIIEKQPTADVAVLVRCKDCKHRYVPCRCALWYGTANDTEYFIERGDDFSCSYGIRKEGAKNG